MPFTNMDDELKDALEEVLASRQVPADLSITYDDMHGLWGGSKLTVRGDGWLERQARPRGSPAPRSSKKQIGEHELLGIVRLLVELSAWEQRTPNTPSSPNSSSIPDESRSQLTVYLKGNTSQVWERFNEMLANDRLVRIKHWIEGQFGDLGDDPTKVPSTLPRQQTEAESAHIPLTSPRQLPELESEKLILTWDQIDAESIILHAGRVIWRERTGWEVYERFEEIAGILKQKYGKRLVDIVPTPRSLYALYGDSTRAYFHVTFVRESLGKDA